MIAELVLSALTVLVSGYQAATVADDHKLVWVIIAVAGLSQIVQSLRIARLKRP